MQAECKDNQRLFLAGDAKRCTHKRHLMSNVNGRTPLLMAAISLIGLIALGVASWTASELRTKVSIREMDHVLTRLTTIESKLDVALGNLPRDGRYR